MSNSKMINTCENCGQLYCMECSKTLDWQNYCSKQCETEALENILDSFKK